MCGRPCSKCAGLLSLFFSLARGQARVSVCVYGVVCARGVWGARAVRAVRRERKPPESRRSRCAADLSPALLPHSRLSVPCPVAALSCQAPPARQTSSRISSAPGPATTRGAPLRLRARALLHLKTHAPDPAPTPIRFSPSRQPWTSSSASGAPPTASSCCALTRPPPSRSSPSSTTRTSWSPWTGALSWRCRVSATGERERERKGGHAVCLGWTGTRCVCWRNGGAGEELAAARRETQGQRLRAQC